MQTLRQWDRVKTERAYKAGYTDGSMGRISREKHYRDQHYAAYVAGYAHGFDATQQIFQIAG